MEPEQSIQIDLYLMLDELVDFYKKDTKYGTNQYPFNADPFCKPTSNLNTNPTDINNAFVLSENTVYCYNIYGTDNYKLLEPEKGAFCLFLVKDIPTAEDWNEIIDFNFSHLENPADKPLIIQPEIINNSYQIRFKTLSVEEGFEQNCNLKYYIGFVFVKNDLNENENMYGIIEPLIINTTEDGL